MRCEESSQREQYSSLWEFNRTLSPANALKLSNFPPSLSTCSARDEAEAIAVLARALRHFLRVLSCVSESPYLLLSESVLVPSPYLRVLTFQKENRGTSLEAFLYQLEPPKNEFFEV